MLTRGLALLAAYGPGEVELSQIELARRTGLPKPTVHRLVAELVQWQAMERTDTGVRLGPWLHVLGENVPSIDALRWASRPHLDRLHQLTGAFACVSVAGRTGVIDVASAGPVPWRHHDPARGSVSAAAYRALRRGTAEPAVAVVHGRPRCSPRPGQRPLAVLASVATAVLVAGGTIGAVSVVGGADRVTDRTVGGHVRATATALGRELSLSAVFGA